jgi:hypothetical protein
MRTDRVRGDVISTFGILSDGTKIVAGDPAGELHLWNKHVPSFCFRRTDDWLGEASASVDGAFVVSTGLLRGARAGKAASASILC